MPTADLDGFSPVLYNLSSCGGEAAVNSSITQTLINGDQIHGKGHHRPRRPGTGTQTAGQCSLDVSLDISVPRAVLPHIQDSRGRCDARPDGNAPLMWKMHSVLLCGALCGSVILAGCGDSTSSLAVAPTSTSTSTPTPTLAPTATVTATPSALQLSGSVTDAQPKPLGGVSCHRLRRRAASQRQRLHRGRWIVPAFRRWRRRRTSCAPSASAMWSRTVDVAAQRGPATATSRSRTIADITDQLPAIVLPVADPLARRSTSRATSSRACANCHQIGNFEFRESRTAAEWEALVNRMIGYGAVPFFDETRQLLLPTLISTFANNPTFPHFAPPPPPRGDAVRAVDLRVGDRSGEQARTATTSSSGIDGTVYTVPGVYSLNPATMERAQLSDRRTADIRSSATPTATCGSPRPDRSS